MTTLYSHNGRAASDEAVRDDIRRLTWGELDERSNAVGHGALAYGLVPGDHVAIVATNRTEFVEALNGVQRAGLVVTPVKTSWTPREISDLLADAQTKLVITDVDAARDLGVATVDLDRGYEQWLARQETRSHPADRTGWRMSYTSGTTGRPKGVVRTNVRPFMESFAAQAAIAEIMHLPGDGPHLVASALFHGAPLTFALAVLSRGASLRLMPRWDAGDGLRRLRDDVASTCFVPTMFRQLLAQPSRPALPELRTLLHGGEPCPAPVKRAMLDWVGPVLVEYYGFTEGGMTVCTSEEWLAHPGTVGRAVHGGRIVIADEHTGAELPPGSIGRVCFEAPGRVFEYRGDPDKTARAHVGNAYTAGDIGYVDEDGYLFLCGRSAEVIVSAGVNVYPAETEDVLYAVPGVADACVVGGPDERRGETVVAFVALEPGWQAADVLKAIEVACEQLLASYKRPRRVEVRDEIPRDPTGKLLRTKLRDELWP